MICSSCGYENPAGHRFCGMCGTPLPHRPLTTPGAQSTLSMTRVPIDLREQAARAEGASPSDAPPAATNTVAATPNLPHGDIADASTTSTAAMTNAVPAKELVPDIPYDEFLKSFRYEPPSDPDEITMRGDAKLQEVASQAVHTPQPEVTENIPFPSEAGSTSDTSAPVADAAITPPSAAPPVDPPIVASPVAPKDSVDSRLGLESCRAGGRKCCGREGREDRAAAFPRHCRAGEDRAAERSHRPPTRAPRPSWVRRSSG